MSLYDYHYSLHLTRDDPPFYALIMAAMSKADSDNIELLKAAFPEVWLELSRRYHRPLGVLEEEMEVTNMDELAKEIKENPKLR